jgi:hypothetical protein
MIVGDLWAIVAFYASVVAFFLKPPIVADGKHVNLNSVVFRFPIIVSISTTKCDFFCLIFCQFAFAKL